MHIFGKMRLWWDLVVKLCIPSQMPSWPWGGNGVWWSHEGRASCWIIIGQVEDFDMMNWMEKGGENICWSDGSLIIRSWCLRKSELWIGCCPCTATPFQLICESQWLEAPPLKTRIAMTRRPPRLSPLQSSHAPDRYLHYQRSFQTIL